MAILRLTVFFAVVKFQEQIVAGERMSGVGEPYLLYGAFGESPTRRDFYFSIIVVPWEYGSPLSLDRALLQEKKP